MSISSAQIAFIITLMVVLMNKNSKGRAIKNPNARRKMPRPEQLST
jgi:hypothetical protein